MSDNIPFEIQSEIIKRLPVISIVQFRSVCKQWKSLIDSPEFITNCKTPKQHHLLVRYKLANEHKYVWIVDDHTFPNQKNSSVTIPKCVVLPGHTSTVTSASGLLCFYSKGKKLVVLWNPCVRKTVSITIPNVLRQPNGHTFIAFGVCPITSDPKLVRINTTGPPTMLNWEVEVFTLSARVWKTVSSPDFRTCSLNYAHVSVDGVIYWVAYDTITLTCSKLIISFDLMTDEFGQVSLPGRLLRTMNKFKISKVYESLGLFEYYTEDRTRFCDVWIMKEKSFTKIFNIKAPDSWVLYKVLEIRQNGEAIIEAIDATCSFALEVYEPSSGRSSGLGINGASGSISVKSFMETLLLLDVPNTIIC